MSASAFIFDRIKALAASLPRAFTTWSSARKKARNDRLRGEQLLKDFKDAFQSHLSPELEQRQASVLAEIEALGPDHSWAGIYSCGMALVGGTSLSLGLEHGFFRSNWHDCGPPMQDYDYGRVVAEEGYIRLISEQFPEGFDTRTERYQLLQWGERRYLLPDHAWLPFCAEVNAGCEPRSDSSGNGRFLLREGDEMKPAPGLPAVPEEFRKFLLEKPIKAKVTAVRIEELRPDGSKAIIPTGTATVDAGEADGLFFGAKFYTSNLKEYFGYEMTALKEHSCELTFTTLTGGKLPKIGSEVSTAPDYQDGNQDLDR
ncbi:MAG: hypothetical protein H7Y20_19845 [Bryobacteraceae bacterium]|nr:hypothetical protein [Bryobacteraceae bacterium]